ncbi:MAG TPA: S16 family serine protease, partial [Steroidobacteraceae bacterium]|nr:S16 family serine protease [Steroidobacteraceae bacterium]
VRSDVAMTGEITLRGEVLPIGGLKEKLLAAHRGGITTVLIPDENTKDLAEIADNIKEKLDIRPVKWIDEVLQVALTHMPAPLPAPEAKPTETSMPVAMPAEKPRRKAARSKTQPRAH